MFSASALQKNVTHTRAVTSQLKKRLFAIESEIDQTKNAVGSTKKVLGDMEATANAAGSKLMSPRGHGHLDTAAVQKKALLEATSSVGAEIAVLGAALEQLQFAHAALQHRINWLEAVESRDNACATSLPARKEIGAPVPPPEERVKPHGRALAVCSPRRVAPLLKNLPKMNETTWSAVCNATFVAAGEAMAASSAARNTSYLKCRDAGALLIRARKAAADALSSEVQLKMTERHDLNCEGERLEKRRRETQMSLLATDSELREIRAPIRVTKQRTKVRDEAPDGVGSALTSERTTAEAGKKQLHRLRRQLAHDLTSIDSDQQQNAGRISQVDQALANDRAVIMADSALPLAPQKPSRRSLKVVPTAQVLLSRPNPIAWVHDDVAGMSPAQQAENGVTFSLWSNMRARHLPPRHQNTRGKPMTAPKTARR
jgi:hypothetical protein